MNLLSIPPSPVRAMGGSPVGTKKVKLDIKPTSPDVRVRILQNHLATLAKICMPGRALEGMADPAVGAGEVHLTAIPEAPRTLISTNDNYCVKDPVLTTRSLNVVLTETRNSSVNCSVASPVHFATNNVRQPQKKGLSPLLKNKSEIKFVNCVSFVGPCVSAPTVPNARSVVHAPLVGGCLQPFWQTWARLGANPRVVSILKEGYVLPFRIKPPLVRHPLVVSGYANPHRNLSLKEAVQNLLGKKAVEMVRVRASLAFFNRLFIVPKLNQKWRPILDLSALNKFLSVKAFKMETPETIRNSLHQREWVSSLDFSDSYFHIPIHTESQKYLRFHFQNQSFQFRALSFGLSTAPMEFTCVFKEIKLMAQSRGIRIHQYLNDWLIQAPTKESCHQGTQSLLTLCQELGWVVNLQKSELEPKQRTGPVT